jgi:hypothetical protein
MTFALPAEAAVAEVAAPAAVAEVADNRCHERDRDRHGLVTVLSQVPQSSQQSS